MGSDPFIEGTKNEDASEASMTKAARHDSPANHERGIRHIEIMAGFSVACVLTLAFMDNLTTSGHTALGMFSVAAPMLVLLRIDGEPPPPYHLENFWGFLILWLGLLLDVLGFGFLIWQKLHWAAIAYFCTIPTCLVVWTIIGRWRPLMAAIENATG